MNKILNKPTVDFMIYFTKHLTVAYQSKIKVITIYKASQVPWVTTGILASRTVKNKLYKKFIKNPTDTSKKSYKVYRNKFNKIKRIAKKVYYSNKLNELKGNLRLTWKLINEIINKNKSRSELPSDFLKEDNMISDPLEIANYLNEYFVNIGPNLAKKIPESPVNFKSYLDERNCNSIFLDAILESEVAKEISQLKVTKSGGYDEMSSKVIRGISNHIVKPLTHIQSITSYWHYSR